LRKPGARREYWTAEEERILGTASDAEVARRLDRTVNSVKDRRKSLKRPDWREKQ